MSTIHWFGFFFKKKKDKIMHGTTPNQKKLGQYGKRYNVILKEKK